MNILIAEREQIVSETICDFLNTHNTTCVFTTSDAIKKYAEALYHVVIFSLTITDNDLTDKSGKEKIEDIFNYKPGTGVKEFIKQYPDARVIIITGYDEEDLPLSEFKEKNIEIIYKSAWEKISDVVGK